MPLLYVIGTRTPSDGSLDLQAVSEELERRRQERLTSWEAGVGLDKEAKQALGKFSPRVAWLFISSKVVDAVELDPEKSQRLAEDSGLFQPQDHHHDEKVNVSHVVLLSKLLLEET